MYTDISLGRASISPTSNWAPARYPSLVDDLPLTHAALEFAAARHDGQRREADHAPFILHPLEVAQLLRGCAMRDEVIAAPSRDSS